MTTPDSIDHKPPCDFGVRGMTIEHFIEKMRFADSYRRLPTLLEFAPFIKEAAWLRVLGEEWPAIDNIGIHLDELLSLTPFGERVGNEAGPIVEMMNEEARGFYDSLPDEVVIYRGCYARNKWGLSWTLDRQVAARFPYLQRYRQEAQPLLVKARIKKANILAVFVDRGEAEIVAFRPRHISTSRLRQMPAAQGAVP